MAFNTVKPGRLFPIKVTLKKPCAAYFFISPVLTNCAKIKLPQFSPHIFNQRRANMGDKSPKNKEKRKKKKDSPQDKKKAPAAS
jgi:hypothetical protein